ncbi:MAG TPA: oligoribonuclease [Acidimicrobiales bacterium]|nr:oligoribonuclease [Acidimicrobiales bacterium]
MLVWMDLEMTGLDPLRHVVVEMATLVTDDDLKIVAEGPDIVIHASPEQLAEMDETVVNMHTRSGLLPLIQTSTVTIEEATAQTLAFIRLHFPRPQSAPLCGNSIGMDRRFLVQHAPELESYLHYRSIDVSSVKELARRWSPAVYGGAPKKGNSHRALDDIRESVAELAYYRDSFFKLPQAPAPVETPSSPS